MHGGGTSDKVSETRVANWKRALLDGGGAAVESGSNAGPNAAERTLAAEVEELKTALCGAHIELRVWRKSAEYRLGPSRTSR